MFWSKSKQVREVEKILKFNLKIEELKKELPFVEKKFEKYKNKIMLSNQKNNKSFQLYAFIGCELPQFESSNWCIKLKFIRPDLPSDRVSLLDYPNRFLNLEEVFKIDRERFENLKDELRFFNKKII